MNTVHPSPFSQASSFTLEQIGSLDEHTVVQLPSEDLVEMPMSPIPSIENPDVQEIMQTLEIRLQQVLAEKGIVLPTCAQFAEELRQQPSIESTLKLLACTVFGGFLGVCGLSSVASIQLLRTTTQSVITPDGANLVTNAAGLLGMFTDMPAMAYVLYLSVFQGTRAHAQCALIEEVYNEMAQAMAPAVREEFYQYKIRILGSVTGPGPGQYLFPDPQSEQGALHAELAPTLEVINQEILEHLSFQHMIPSVAQTVMANWRKLPVKECGKEVAAFLGRGSFCLAIQAFACWMLVACGRILSAAQYDQFLTGDAQDINNATNWFTNIGAIFPSTIAMGMATYMMFYMGPIAAARRQVIEKTVINSFNAHLPSDVSNAATHEFQRIRQVARRQLT